MYPRQGAQIAVLGGRPTVLGGFHDYDQYPDMVEQFDMDSGRMKNPHDDDIKKAFFCQRILVPPEAETTERKKIFWTSSCT